MARAFDVYSEALRLLNPLLIRKIVALARIADFPKTIPDAPLESTDPEFVGPQPLSKGWQIEKKNLAVHCAQGAMIPLASWPGLDDMVFWPDPDTSKIATAAGRKKFSTQLGLYVDRGNNEEPKYVEVMYKQGPKPPLLQVADLIAYVAQRCAAAYTSNDLRFKALNKIIAAEQVRLRLGPDGGFLINVPDSSIDFQGPRPPGARPVA